MKYVIQKQVGYKINTFYHNVAKKYKHTYSEEMMHKNLNNAFNSIYKIDALFSVQVNSLYIIN